MLCPSSASQQHSRTFSNTVFDRHRCFDQMVAWQTCPQGISLTSTMVPFSKSSITVEEISYVNGIFRCWTTKYLAILLPSRQCSSSMLPSLTYSAITNKPLRTGRRPIHHSAVANPGQITNPLPSIRQILIGYYPVLFFTRCFHRNSL